jgi:hypothetical protein
MRPLARPCDPARRAIGYSARRMSLPLREASDDFVRCAICGAPAVGPCASCHLMVCGDCCVLTEGGVETYAICVRCDRKKGRRLSPAWRRFLLACAILIVALAAYAAIALFVLR